MIKRIILTIFFLLIATIAWADTEYLVPTSFVNGDWIGTVGDIETYPTINTTTLVYTTDNKASSGQSSFSDPVTVQSGDTITSVTAYIHSQLTGTPGDEYINLIITCTSGSDTLSTGSNGTWTTDSQANTNCVNYSDLAGAVFTLAVVKIGSRRHHATNLRNNRSDTKRHVKHS
jgi:hypothetical protein